MSFIGWSEFDATSACGMDVAGKEPVQNPQTNDMLEVFLVPLPLSHILKYKNTLILS
jgi:hypothetical protein